MEDFPSNSRKSKEREEKPKIERVVSGKAVRRRKPLGKQFKETFIGGDIRSTTQYVIFEVLIPEARDMMFEAFSQGMQRLIFGESKRRGGAYRSGSRAMGHFDYSGISRNRYDKPPEPRTMSRRGRARHDFDEIVITSRAEGEEVIDAMFELLSKFDEVSVADLYTAVGLESNHVDESWGWEDLQGASVMKVRGGYLLDLPDPQPLK